MNQLIWSTVIIAFLCAFLLTWIPVMLIVERRAAAWMQRRSGPNRVGPFGLMQPMSDAIKMIFKEANIPRKANKVLFVMAPALAVLPPFIAMIVIPLGGSVNIGGTEYAFQAFDVRVGLMFFLAITSLHVYSVLTAGWASNNKFSLMGGLRAASQMISYEIAIGISMVSLVMTYGTLDLREIVKLQEAGGGLPAWGAALQPIAFIVLWICAFAETNRLPFDLPEGESELVAGYHTEYSGMTFGMFMLGEYAAMVAASAFLATLFLGGYNIPFVSEEALRQFFLNHGLVLTAASAVTVLLQFASLVAKICFFMWIFVHVRWTLPRFRYDQLMDLGWKMLLPIGVANAIGTMIVTYILRRGT
ncbi:MAG: NADH-quinone oxidoreductase subunit NuoH [Bdellovibrionota bacterium]